MRARFARTTEPLLVGSQGAVHAGSQEAQCLQPNEISLIHFIAHGGPRHGQCASLNSDFPKWCRQRDNPASRDYGFRTTARRRRACSKAHFDAYFRFSLGDETLPRNEIDQLIARAADDEFVTAAFREALTVKRSNGSTKAALLLDELNLHAEKVTDVHVGPLLATIFKLGDELHVDADAARGFSIANNQLRIHWLLRRLTLDRFDLAKRSAIFVTACKKAALGWLIDFAESAYRDYHPREGKNPEPEQNCLTTLSDAESLHRKELGRIRGASKSDELGDHRELPYLLYRWRDVAHNDGAEVKQWTNKQLAHDDMVVKFAKAFTSYSWSQGLGFAGMGDMVARRDTRANVNTLEMIMDKARFRARVEELAAKEALAKPQAEIIRTFLDAWLRHDKNPHD
jgi:hypothetical protein